MNRQQQLEMLQDSWNSERYAGIKRPYTPEDVLRLRGSLLVEHTLAKKGAEKLWKRVNEEDFVPALGALTGNQAVQQVKAGLQAIYLSGWQVAADANLSGHMYPDQSLYPANSVPQVVKRINQAFSAPIKSSMPNRKETSTSSCRSWPMRKRALGERSMCSN